MPHYKHRDFLLQEKGSEQIGRSSPLPKFFKDPDCFDSTGTPVFP